MELSELSLRVEKLEEIIQKLAKWTNFNLSTCQSSLNDWKTLQNKNQSKRARFEQFEVVKSTSEITNAEAVEDEFEDPMSSVVIKMESGQCEEVAHYTAELPENNVELSDRLSNSDEDPPFFISSELSETSSDFEGLTEAAEPLRKRRKRSIKMKYEPLKVLHKSSLPPSEPFVSLRPLTPSQLPKKKGQKSNDLKCPSCPREFKMKIAFNKHIRSGICRRGARPFACPHCPHAATRKRDLPRHIQAKHPTEATEDERLHRRFNCPECPKTYRYKGDLTRHISNNHNKTEKTFLCDSCPYLGKNYNNFRQHIRNNHKEPSFFCYFCPWKGRRMGKLTIHLRTHTGEKPYKCPHCIYTSSKDNAVKSHVKSIHGKEEGSIQCPKCPSRFKTPGCLAKHLEIHDGWKCRICEFEAFTEASAKEHQNSHKTEDGMFQCPHCPITCTRMWDLPRHIKTHTEEKPYKCGNCERAFRNEADLRKHEIYCKNAVNRPRPFACPHCPYAAATRGTLSGHIKSLHPATEEERLQRPFKCPQCPKTFRFKHKLSRHIRSIHNTSGNTFLCDFCPYLGNNVNNFRQHMNNNHKEPSFFCYFCPWKGRRLDKLTIHIRKHTGEKPYKCPHCIYKSSEDNAVKSHVKRLHGKEEGSFQCPKCPSKFKSLLNLRKHLKMHDESAYKCGICEFEGSNDASLREHYNNHKTEDGAFRCPHCPKTIKRRRDLPRHIKTHTGEMPYRCGNCEYASVRKDKLENHEMICKGYCQKNPEKNQAFRDGEELHEQNATSARTAQDEGNHCT